MLIVSKLGCACLVDPAIVALINMLVLDPKAGIVYKLEQLNSHWE